MANGQGTYDVIMEHLAETKGILPINLRINVDYDNVAAADQVVETLREKDLLQSVHPYLGLVTTQNDVYEPEKCLSNEQYSKINLDFLLRQQIPLSSMYPMPKKNACTADFITAGSSTIQAPCTNAGMISAFLKSPLATSTRLTTTFTGQI